MKKFIFPFALFITIFSCQPASSSIPEKENGTERETFISTTAVDTNLHDGDIIFQTSGCGQSAAIQLATHSKYSHCGVLFNDGGKWFVYEAVQPVSKTPFEEWITHGDHNYYVVKRLKNADSVLTKPALNKMHAYVTKNLGKNYDIAFDWSDENFYCSELVWKAYHEATGLEVGQTKPLGEYDLSNPVVKEQLARRYGKNVPLKEPMISPGSIYDSELLVTVKEH